MLTLRTITSAGTPVSGAGGTLYTGDILWSLVDASGSPVNGVDDATGQLVVYWRVAVACVDGIFTTGLWPTDHDRTGRDLRYNCEIAGYSVTGPFPYGSGVPVSFSEWLLGGDMSDPITIDMLGYVTPEMFGAKGDGVTDDTAAIQAALNSGSNEVRFTQTYCVGSTNANGTGALTLTSAHNGLTLSGPGTIKAQSSGTNWFYLFLLTTAKDISVRGLTFDGNANANFTSNPATSINGHHAFYFKPAADYDVQNINFTDCKFTGTYDGAIQSYGSSAHTYPHPVTRYITISNCKFYDSGAHGVGMNEWYDSAVSGCTFQNIGKKVMISGYGSGMGVDVSGGCKNIIVDGNIVDGAAAGFKTETHSDTVFAENVVISNNTVKNLYSTDAGGGDYTVWYGIKLSGKNNKAVNNTIASYGRGVFIDYKAENCSAIGNHITEATCDVTRPASGIYIEWNAVGGHLIEGNNVANAVNSGIFNFCQNVAIKNNIVHNNTGDGIRIADGVTAGYDQFATSASGNVCYDNTGSGIYVCKTNAENPTTISNVTLSSNVCFDSGASVQQRGIFVANDATITNVIENGNLCFDNTVGQLAYTGETLYSVEAGKKTIHWNSAPTTGTWAQGDRVIHTFPSVTSPSGWVCVTAGSPGTWSPMPGVVATGASLPSSTPSYIGQEYLDTTAKKAYKAFGTTSSADWEPLN